MAKLVERESQSDRKMTNDTIPLLLQKTSAEMKPVTREEGGPNRITLRLVIGNKNWLTLPSQSFYET